MAKLKSNGLTRTMDKLHKRAGKIAGRYYGK